MGVIYEGGETIRHVYFPDDGLISLLVVMDDKTIREIGGIGSEGMLGVAEVTPIRKVRSATVNLSVSFRKFTFQLEETM
jgi:hypothetical protein